jgi:hypothetical protein
VRLRRAEYVVCEGVEGVTGLNMVDEEVAMDEEEDEVGKKDGDWRP